jgi:quercetin dioxygenase-like cupin family protein
LKVIHFNQAEKYEPEPDWRRVSLCSQPNVSIEYFVKPPRHASPVHEHPNEQVTIVTKGKMVAIDVFAPGRSFDFWLQRLKK